MPGAIALVTILLAAIAGAIAQHATVDDKASGNRYPNELPKFRFFQTSSWRYLKPLVSSMKDVRDVLGEPQEASDVSQFTTPYPGDAEAKKPVFTYKINDEWEALVYFCKYCFHSRPKDIPGDRLCSIDLIPTRRISFKSVKFPPVFKRRHIQAVDAAWDEYSDGIGLRYEVYTTRTPYGKQKPGDLNRISYGPPPEVGYR